MAERPARSMSDLQIADELATLYLEWAALRAGLDECGGMSGSPGEWIYERTNELETEQKRRASDG